MEFVRGGKKKRSAKSKSRSAKKAWRTRRALSKKRSRSAKKAWRTRRSKSRKSRKSRKFASNVAKRRR